MASTCSIVKTQIGTFFCQPSLRGRLFVAAGQAVYDAMITVLSVNVEPTTTTPPPTP